MPSPEVWSLKQKAAMWQFSSFDNNGEELFLAPVEISVRWEEANTEVVGPDGTPITASITVDVDRDIVLGSLMRRGTLVSVPATPDNIHAVLTFDSTPDIKGRKFARSVTLGRYKKSVVIG